LILECTAAAEKADDEGDSADADEDDRGVRDVRMRAADVDHVLITDDRRMKLHRDAAADQRRSTQLQQTTDSSYSSPIDKKPALDRPSLRMYSRKGDKSTCVR